MDLEINKPLNGGLKLASQEVKLAKLDLALYLGQALKAVVLTPLTNGEVTVNINGQTVNAKTTHQFTPGEAVDVKVVSTEDEIVLQVQQAPLQNLSPQKTLQNALLQTLPNQAPPTNLLDNLEQLLETEQTTQQINKLPPQIVQQIKTLLATIPGINQLPQQILKVIDQSGLFLESTLLNWQEGMPKEGLQTDLKAQYLKLLNSLPAEVKSTLLTATNSKTLDANNQMVQKEALPLPGVVPQPLHKNATFNLAEQSPENVQKIIHEQVNQVLSRITAHQVNHLAQENRAADDVKAGFLIMMDIPIKTPENDIDVIPLMIKQQKATSFAENQWSISFAVSLSQLGDMQATVSVNGSNVAVKINTEKQDTITTLQNYQGEMEGLLNELGLKLGNFNIQLGLENNHIETDELHLLDIRV